MVQSVTVPTPAQPFGGGDVQAAFTALETALNTQFGNQPTRPLKKFAKSSVAQTLQLGAINLLNASDASKFTIPNPTYSGVGVADETMIIKIYASTLVSNVSPASSLVKIYGLPASTINPRGSSVAKAAISFVHQYQMAKLQPVSSIAYMLTANVGYLKSS